MRSKTSRPDAKEGKTKTETKTKTNRNAVGGSKQLHLRNGGQGSDTSRTICITQLGQITVVIQNARVHCLQESAAPLSMSQNWTKNDLTY
jgi:hypothetical protein